jgi:cytochrome oxidase Cu insertion factor (SCO1/SenC/PrrC family)
MKNFKRLLSALLAAVMLMSMAAALAGCELFVEKLEGCTVSVTSEGGKVMADIGVYIYKDEAKTDLVEFVKTDDKGVATFTLPVPVGSRIVLDNLPAGYVAEESYTVETVQTDIVVNIQLQEQMGKIALGDVMFDFTVTDVEGTEYTLSKLLETKKAVVLNLWYTNCQPCQAEFPYLIKAYKYYADDIALLAIDPEGDSAEDIAAFATEYGFTFPAIEGEEGWTQVLSNLAYPTTIVIDRFGTVGMIHTGSVDRAKIFKDVFAYFTSDDYVQSTVEHILDVETPAAVGELENPQEIAGVMEFEVTVPADEEYYCNLFRASGMDLTVESDALKLTCGNQVYESAEGVLKMQLPISNDPSTPLTLCFTNTGAEAQTYKVVLTYPEGHMENPKALELGKATVDVAEGNSQGFFLSFTATEKGDLTLKNLKKDKGYDVVLYNLTTSVQKTLAENAVTENKKTELRLFVEEGDQVQIQVVAVPGKDGSYPAVSVSFTSSMEEPAPNYEGTLSNPDEPVEQYGFNSFSIDLAAGEKKLVYMIRTINDATLSTSDKYAYVVYNGKTYKPANGVICIPLSSKDTTTAIVLEIGNAGIEDKTFKVNFYFAAGTRENPIKLKDGENTIKCASGNDQGTFYSYKAGSSGTLTLDVTGINPSNVVCGISISDMQTYPNVVALEEGSTTVSIYLPAGAKAEIIFSTKDAKKEWKIPAAEITVNATFE